MIKEPNIGIVLLAAGSASRMKENKLLLEIDGKTLLENAVSAALDSRANFVTTVLGAYAEDLLKVIEKYSVGICLNENYQHGIGSSIKSGLEQSLKSHPKTAAIIISVCDQPFLSKEIFNGLIATYEKTGKRIIASAYSNSIGVPVLYDKNLFNELLKIPDKHGAKKYIVEKAAEEIITTFPFPKGEIDIDTFEDLKKLLHPNGRGN